MANLTHWKIKDMANGMCHYVPVHNPGERVLDAIVDYMALRKIKPAECRVLESGGGRGIDKPWRDFVLEWLERTAA